MMSNEDLMSTKRTSLSSITSTNTFKSLSTYQSYVSYGTLNNSNFDLASKTLSRRLLDDLDFTEEEEKLIRALKKNGSTKDFGVESFSSLLSNNLNTKLTSNSTENLHQVRNNGNNGKYRNVKRNTSNSINRRNVIKQDEETDNQRDDNKVSSKSTRSTSKGKVEFEFPYKTSKSPNSSAKTPSPSHDKPKHKKTKSWSISSSSHSNKDKDKDATKKSMDTEVPPALFIKQHKKKNSSFSIKNLFKKPASQPNSATTPQKPNFKVDSFHSLDAFQNNGNDFEFMGEPAAMKENKEKRSFSENYRASYNEFDDPTKSSQTTSVESVDKETLLGKRRNLISSEMLVSANSRHISQNENTDIIGTLDTFNKNIDKYITRAISLKQSHNFKESTDCLLLSILEYKRKYVYLRDRNMNDDDRERTPFLLYGIAQKMGIGCDADIDGSVENLKIACGIMAPVYMENEETINSADSHVDIQAYVDENNMVIPHKYINLQLTKDSDIKGPAFYELSLNYLFPYLNVSINSSEYNIDTSNGYSLHKIKEGLKYLSESILSYDYADSYTVLLEIFGKGIKMSKYFVIEPNQSSYNEWLEICKSKTIDVPSDLRNINFSSLNTLNQLAPVKLKRNDTLERLHMSKDISYSSSEDESDDNEADSSGMFSSEKIMFERNHYSNNDDADNSDDELSEIMETYI